MSAEEQSHPVVLPGFVVADLQNYLDRSDHLREVGRVDDSRDVLVEMAGYLRAALDRAGGVSDGT